MALVKGICKNYVECDLADSKEIQEVEKTNFICKKCGKPLYTVKGGNTRPSKKPPINKIVIIITTIILLGGTVTYLCKCSKCGGDGDVPKDTILVESIVINPSKYELTIGDTMQLTVTIIPYDATDTLINWSSSNSDVVKVSNGMLYASHEGTAIVSAQSNDGNAAAEITVTVKKPNRKKKPKNVIEPIPKSNVIFKGSLKNGVPHGHGVLYFRVRQRIDTHDEKERTAEKGDYIQGEWKNGHLLMGRWFGANNIEKEFIIIGGGGDPEPDHDLYRK